MNAREIPTAIRNGETTAKEVLETYLEAIHNREEEIHAFNLVLEEEARNEAERIDTLTAEGENLGPLTGIPVAIKDNICTQGVPTTCSSKILDGWRPPYDATIIGRLREA